MTGKARTHCYATISIFSGIHIWYKGSYRLRFTRAFEPSDLGNGQSKNFVAVWIWAMDRLAIVLVQKKKNTDWNNLELRTMLLADIRCVQFTYDPFIRFDGK